MPSMRQRILREWHFIHTNGKMIIMWPFSKQLPVDLLCCVGMLLKLCSGEVGNNTENEQKLCKSSVESTFDSYTASLLLIVCLTLGMAIISILSIHFLSS